MSGGSIPGGKFGHSARTAVTYPRVGHYGCARLDRLVRVREKELRKFPFSAAATVDCPCGSQHRVVVTWRKLREGEDPAGEVTV